MKPKVKSSTTGKVELLLCYNTAKKGKNVEHKTSDV